MKNFLDLELTDALVQSVIPNNIVAVDGEMTLSDSVAPFVDDALLWLRDALFGDEPCPEDARSLAVRVVMLRAVKCAIPSLDLVVTPSGFAVMSSNSLAPASKERVQRLVDSLAAELDESLMTLQKMLLFSEDWRASAVGSWFCSSSLSRLSDVRQFRKYEPDMMTLYRRVHDIAAPFEAQMAREYLGESLMSRLRAGIADGSLSMANRIVGLLRAAVSRFVRRSLEGLVHRCPDPHEVWHPAEAILDVLPSCTELYDLWLEEKGDSFKVEQFVNSRKGGYFF